MPPASGSTLAPPSERWPPRFDGSAASFSTCGSAEFGLALPRQRTRSAWVWPHSDVKCDVANSGLHAFLEFHSVDEATEALCLDGILFMDRALQVRHLLCCRGMYPTHLVRLPIISSAAPRKANLAACMIRDRCNVHSGGT